VTIVIQGFPDTYKRPGFYGETKYGQGGISSGSIPKYLLCIGQMSSGTATADVSIVNIGSDDDADAAFGAGSQIARMCYKAGLEKGIRIKAIAVADASGAAAATGTITIATNSTSAGEWVYRIAGDEVRVAVASGATPTVQATAIKNKINGNPRLPVTATSSSGVVTVTAKCEGAEGNGIYLFQNKQTAPGGSTSTLAGGTAVVSSIPGEDGVPLSGGSGTVDITNALAVLYAGRYHRIACAANDSTNVALLEAQLDAKAAPTVGRMEHAVFGHVGSLSSATSIAQTTLNNERVQLVWLEESEVPAGELAARMAAARLSLEQQNPNSNFDGYVLTGIRAQANRNKWASESSQVSALDNSVTPLLSLADGSVTVVRAITTKSLTSSNPDYRTLDVGFAVTPDEVRDDLALQWATVFLPANPAVREDPAPEEPEPPAGVATPSRWNGFVTSRAKSEWAKKLWILPITAETAPTSEYNNTAKRIMSAVPVKTHPLQHQIGVSVRETSSV
jgi:phage tail sheath gpL-like